MGTLSDVPLRSQRDFCRSPKSCGEQALLTGERMDAGGAVTPAPAYAAPVRNDIRELLAAGCSVEDLERAGYVVNTSGDRKRQEDHEKRLEDARRWRELQDSIRADLIRHERNRAGAS